MSVVLDRLVKKVLPSAVCNRRWLHQHPEIRYNEFATADFIQARLLELGVEPRRVGETGVTALIRGGAAGRKARTVLLRADIDALEIAEQTALPYASTNGCMHACGHDGHAAALLAAAEVLLATRERLPGNVKLIFQPAEELGQGGRLMVKLGIMEDPHVDAAFALHGWPELPAGAIAASPGVAMAACDSLEIVIHGRGGHGAQPQLTVDPILIAARTIESLQSIISRQVTPGNAAVVTIANIQGGAATATNIIPDRARMGGTIRSLNEPTRQMLFDSIRRIASGTARAHGGTARVKIDNGYPATVNEPEMTELVRRVGIRELGEKNVLPQKLSMGAEDFSYYLQKAPGCFFRLGLGRKKGPMVPLHNPMFDFNDDALPTGIRMMVAVAMEALSTPG